MSRETRGDALGASTWPDGRGTLSQRRGQKKPGERSEKPQRREKAAAICKANANQNSEHRGVHTGTRNIQAGGKGNG